MLADRKRAVLLFIILYGVGTLGAHSSEPPCVSALKDPESLTSFLDQKFVHFLAERPRTLASKEFFLEFIQKGGETDSTHIRRKALILDRPFELVLQLNLSADEIHFCIPAINLPKSKRGLDMEFLGFGTSILLAVKEWQDSIPPSDVPPILRISAVDLANPKLIEVLRKFGFVATKTKKNGVPLEMDFTRSLK